MENSPISYRILVVDDDSDILEMLKYNLQKNGYEVKTADNGKDAIEVAKAYLPHLIIMDIMMPKIDGVETSRRIREIPDLADTFIIILTARAEEYSEVAAFDVGVDDYLVKPIKIRALLGRITAFFRRDRKKNTRSQTVSFADLVIDKQSYTVFKNKQPILLPKKEFELLYFLAQNPEKVFSRDDLLQSIWGSDVYVLARTVDVHIRKVREKIGENYIKTIKGVGYKLTADQTDY
ncbi:MAG: DNA-binding response regulator [Cytophagales bacterium]|nr:MAG: DNA-binding response regulator [Cytophagales bacterium]